MLPKFVATGIVSADMIRREKLILFQVQKAEVSASNYDRIAQLIDELNKAKNQGRGKIGLAFAYDDDKRELFEIEEVRAYVKRLFELCPHLLYFLAPDQNAVRTFLFCLIDAKVKSRSSGYAQIDADETVMRSKGASLADAVMSYGTTAGDLAGAQTHLSALGMR